jgi:hypothetical protein
LRIADIAVCSEFKGSTISKKAKLMRQAPSLILTNLALAAYFAHGEAIYQFDQSVSPTDAPNLFANIQPAITGESFVPTLSSIGFAQFYLNDASPVLQSSTLYVILWSGSSANSVYLGQTAPVTVGPFSAGATTFYFSNPVTVTPGSTYFLQPIVQSGDNESAGVVPGYRYANGMAYIYGNAAPVQDLWFSEGIVVPEPSTFSLAIVGLVGIAAVSRRLKAKNRGS